MLQNWTGSLVALGIMEGVFLVVAIELVRKLVINKRTRLFGLAVALCGLLAFAFVGRTACEYVRPYDLTVRNATFSTILSGSPGRAVVIENHDSRTVTIYSVTINGDLKLTKLVKSTPRGKEVQFPVIVAPGNGLDLMVSDAALNFDLLPRFDDFFPPGIVPPASKMSKPHPQVANPPTPIDVLRVVVQTDRGKQEYRPTKSTERFAVGGSSARRLPPVEVDAIPDLPITGGARHSKVVDEAAEGLRDDDKIDGITRRLHEASRPESRAPSKHPDAASEQFNPNTPATEPLPGGGLFEIPGPTGPPDLGSPI